MTIINFEEYLNDCCASCRGSRRDWRLLLPTLRCCRHLPGCRLAPACLHLCWRTCPRLKRTRHNFTIQNSNEPPSLWHDTASRYNTALSNNHAFPCQNKPGTAKAGAISKAQNARSFQNCKKGDPLGFLKLQFVGKNQKKIEGRLQKKIFKSKN